MGSNPVGRANSFKGLIERSTTPCRLEGTFPITLVGGCPLPTHSRHLPLDYESDHSKASRPERGQAFGKRSS